MTDQVPQPANPMDSEEVLRQITTILVINAARNADRDEGAIIDALPRDIDEPNAAISTIVDLIRDAWITVTWPNRPNRPNPGRRECTSLCTDVEEDRDALAAQIELITPVVTAAEAWVSETGDNINAWADTVDLALIAAVRAFQDGTGTPRPAKAATDAEPADDHTLHMLIADLIAKYDPAGYPMPDVTVTVDREMQRVEIAGTGPGVIAALQTLNWNDALPAADVAAAGNSPIPEGTP